MAAQTRCLAYGKSLDKSSNKQTYYEAIWQYKAVHRRSGNYVWVRETCLWLSYTTPHREWVHPITAQQMSVLEKELGLKALDVRHNQPVIDTLAQILVGD